MLALYFADVTALMADDRYEAAYAHASKTRRDKADRLIFRPDKNRCIAAGSVLDIALSPFGFREADMGYGQGENGKPFFRNAPDLHFNLSHSGDFVMVGLSDRPLGCDIEKIDSCDLRLADRFFTSRERETLLQAPEGSEREKTFFRLWTLKESYVKALGCGFAMPFDSFEFCLDGARPVLSGGSCGDWSFWEPSVCEGYRSAVCTSGEPEEPGVLLCDLAAGTVTPITNDQQTELISERMN